MHLFFSVVIAIVGLRTTNGAERLVRELRMIVGDKGRIFKERCRKY